MGKSKHNRQTQRARAAFVIDGWRLPIVRVNGRCRHGDHLSVLFRNAIHLPLSSSLSILPPFAHPFSHSHSVTPTEDKKFAEKNGSLEDVGCWIHNQQKERRRHGMEGGGEGMVLILDSKNRGGKGREEGRVVLHSPPSRLFFLPLMI